MARARRLTYKAGTLSRFIQKYEIGIRWRQVRSEYPERRQYVITLTRPAPIPGYLLSIEIPYFQGLGIPHPPELDRVVWTVGQDMLDYYLSEGDPDYYAETFGLTDPEDLGTAQQILLNVQDESERLQDFLGEEGYDELIEIILGGAEE